MESLTMEQPRAARRRSGIMLNGSVGTVPVPRYDALPVVEVGYSGFAVTSATALFYRRRRVSPLIGFRAYQARIYNERQHSKGDECQPGNARQSM